MRMFLLVVIFVAVNAWGAFEGTPSQLLERGKTSKVDADEQMVVLDEHTRMRFDAQGRRTLTYHRAFYLRHADAVEDNSTISVSFTPWYQARPVIKARVITADQKVHWLEASTLVDSPALEYEKDIYSDRRIVSAPLPAVAAGSVVEYEYVLTDTSPFFRAGTLHSWTIGEGTPIEHLTLVVEAPASLGLKVKPVLLPEGTLVQSGDVWKLEMKPAPKVLGSLPLLPSTQATRPTVGITTGRSWGDLSKAYSGIVDDKIGSADVSSLVANIDAGFSREKKIDTVLQRIHEQVRYVGIELGDGSIIPRAPAEVLTRHYGDCKDKAALLVAALRKLGIDSNVALLSASMGEDVDLSLPGLGGFNHAITYVPGEKPLWIDATAEDYRLGDLPVADQGRFALVASATARDLVRIPVAGVEANYSNYHREVFLAEDGPARLIETITARGAQEAELRGVYAGEPAKPMRDALKNYAKGTLLSEEQTLLANPAKHDFTKPFEMRWETPAAKRFVIERDGGVAVVLPGPLFGDLPYWFKNVPKPAAGEEDADQKEWRLRNEARKEPFELREPHVAEMTYKIHLPANFKPKALPRPANETFGGARYQREFQLNSEGQIVARLRFEQPKTVLTPAEAKELRQYAAEFVQAAPIILEFIHGADENLALGKPREALDLLRSARDKTPEAAIHHQRLARAYLQTGLGELARTSARKSVELAPKSSSAYRDLAFVLQHDTMGRLFRKGWDREGVIAALRKALEIEDAPVVRADLAITYEHDERGERYSDAKGLELAIAEYKGLGDKLAESGVEQNYPIALLQAGRWDELEKVAAKLPNAALGRALKYVSQAVNDGSTASVLSIQRDQPDITQRVQMFASVGATLLQVRQYERAAELLRAAYRVSPDAALKQRLDVASKAKRFEDLPKEPTKPELVAQRFILSMFRPDFNLEMIRELMWDQAQFDRELAAAKLKGEDPTEELRVVTESAQAQFRRVGVPMRVATDLIAAASEFASSGSDETGYRIEAKMQNASDMGKLYLLPKDGRYRIGGVSNEPTHTRVTLQQLLDAGKLKTVQTWLDWLAEDSKVTDAAGEVTLPLLRYLWSGVNEQARNADAARVVIATMKGDTVEENQASLAILEGALLKAKIPRDRTHLLYGIADRQRDLGKWKEALVTTRKLVAVAPKSSAAFELHCEALIRNGLQAEAETVAKARLKLMAQAIKTNVEMDDEPAQKMLVRLALLRKDYKQASEIQDKMASQRSFNEKAKADALWLRLLAKVTSKPPFELADDSGGSLISNDQAYVLLAKAMDAALNQRPAEASERLTRYLDATAHDLSDSGVRATVAALAGALGESAESTRLWAGVQATKRREKSLADDAVVLLKP